MTSPDNTPEPAETPLTEQEQRDLDRFAALLHQCRDRAAALISRASLLTDQSSPEALIRCTVHIEDLERFTASIPASPDNPVQNLQKFMFHLELAEGSIKAALEPKTGLVVDAIKAVRSGDTNQQSNN